LRLAFFLCAVFLLGLAAPGAFAQDSGVSLGIIEMDIRTSNLSELASWARRLGLPDGGTVADLARRLREHYGLPTEDGRDAAPAGQRVIIIESARSTEYFTIQSVDEEYARLSGDVVISLREGEALHEIRAWEILFNRTRNIISASGGVTYRKTEGDTIETFRGEAIVFDMDNWSGVFLGGATERALAGEGSVYLFAGEVISRDGEGVTVLRNATISNADEESLWSLRATRVWLLQGSDFAIANAVLRVGEIPVFYLPFFFLPSDRMIFHPALGSRAREGRFVNTTTYLLGRPRNVGGSENSLTRIMGDGEGMETVREGIFLRSSGVRAQGEPSPSLSLLVDFYTNLGAYIGTEFSMRDAGVLRTFGLNAGIGLSRTLAPPAVTGSGWSAFWPNFDGETDRNSSWFFGSSLPFRYRLVMDGSVAGRFGTLDLRLPLYSDPEIDGDFMNRMTDMDWFSLISQGASAMEAQGEARSGRITSFSWDLRSSLRPSFPDMRPYVASISIGAITSSLNFGITEAPSAEWTGIRAHSPMRFFFAPRHAILYSASASISGNPLRLASGTPQPVGPDGGEDGADMLPARPVSPFAPREAEDTPPPPRNPADTLVPPALAQRFDLPRPGAGAVFSVNYSFAPTSMTRMDFDHRSWRQPDDVDLGDISTIQTNVTGNARIGLSFSFNDNLVTSAFTFSGDGRWHGLPLLNEEAEEFTHGANNQTATDARIAERRLREYRQTQFSTVYSIDTSVRPFRLDPVFGATRIQHVLTGDAVRSEFIGTGVDPEWRMLYADWTKERVRSHQLVAEINANIMDRNQRLTFTSHLSPLDPAYLARAEFNIWITRTTADWGIRLPEDAPAAQDPLNIVHTISFANFGSFSQTFQVDTEEAFLNRLVSQLNLTSWGLMLRYRARHMTGFTFDTSQSAATPGWGVWVPRSEEPALLNEDFFAQYGKRFDFNPSWAAINTLFFRLDSGLLFDLQRYDNSRLTFGIGSGLETRFMRVTLSASSSNDAVFRYFRNWPMFSDFPIDLGDGRQNNFFLDLFDSFRFSNEEARRRSGFKIRDLVLDVRRFFGDWEASLNWRMQPHRPNVVGANWEMQNTVSFVVKWTPIPEFKTEVDFNQGRSPQWTVDGL